MITIKNLDNNSSMTVVPSSMKWSRMRVSAADSGRDVSGTMYVNQITQKEKLELAFNGLTWQEGSRLLKVCDSQYVQVTYPCMLTGTMQTKTFYTGDREGDVWIWWDAASKKILSQLSFNLIEK